MQQGGRQRGDDPFQTIEVGRGIASNGPEDGVAVLFRRTKDLARLELGLDGQVSGFRLCLQRLSLLERHVGPFCRSQAEVSRDAAVKQHVACDEKRER